MKLAWTLLGALSASAALESHLQQRLQAIASGQDTDLMLFRDLDMVFASDLDQHVLPWFDRHATAAAIDLSKAQVDAYLKQRATPSTS